MNNHGRLLRILGAGFGAAAIIGGSIGAGILRTPGQVAGYLADPVLIMAVWIFGAVYALLGAISVTELGAALPLAGGFYVYVRRTFGDAAGFAIGWCDWLGQVAAVAFASLTMAEYAGGLAPALAGYSNLMAIGAIAVLAALQWFGLKAASNAQLWTSFGKVAIFVALAAACFAGTPAHSVAAPLRTTGLFAAFVLSAQAVLYTYDGWYSAIYFTEEDTAPGANLPRAVVVGVASVALIYLAINGALLRSLSLGELAASKLPAADAVAKVFGEASGRIITVVSLISVPPLMNVVIMMATRILFALSRDSGALAGLTQVTESGAPRPAMLLSCAAAAAMVASGTTERLLAIAGFFYVVNYASAFICVFALRRLEPDLPRPFRAWGFPYSTGAVLGVSIVFLGGAVWSDPLNSAVAVVLMTLCEPLRRVLKR